MPTCVHVSSDLLIPRGSNDLKPVALPPVLVDTNIPFGMQCSACSASNNSVILPWPPSRRIMNDRLFVTTECRPCHSSYNMVSHQDITFQEAHVVMALVGPSIKVKGIVATCFETHRFGWRVTITHEIFQQGLHVTATPIYCRSSRYSGFQG